MSDCTANVAGQDYADFIYRHNAASLEELADTLGTDCISYVNESYVVYHVPLSAVSYTHLTLPTKRT